MPLSNDTLLSRKEAAKRLKISVRTLDRYIRRGYFDVKRIDRSVWISKPSFESYYQDNQDIKDNPGENALKEALSEEISTEVSEAGTTFSGVKPSVDLTAHEHDYKLTPVHIYKSLYEELKDKYDNQVKRLEGAHYRVGQLEAQVKGMVPLLEVKKERQRLLLMDKKYKENIKEAKVRVIQTKRLFEGERLNKNVYIALVYALLAAQPILWILIQS